MKKIYLSLLLGLSVLPFSTVFGQSATVCNVDAGPAQTICAPNCATLTATFTPTNQTTSYTLSQIPYAPDPFNVGTAVALFDDQWSQVIPLPFPFCFYGNVYNSCLIGSNGVVTFALGPAGGYCTWPIPNTPVPTNVAGTPINCIMGPWQDLNPAVGGTVRYATYGVAPCRRFVVSWNAVPMYACGTPATQQITLYETTNIIENYIQSKPACTNWNGGKAIQCIQNQPATNAVVVPGRNTPTQWTATNDARRYTPAGAPTYTINWVNTTTNTSVGTTASVQVCPTQTTTYSVTITYTNCNNNTVTQSDNVTVTSSQLTFNIPAAAPICLGGNVQLNGTVPGGVTYTWSPAIGLTNPNIANPVANPTVTTTYTLTVTDASGCSGTNTVQVVVNPMTTANAGVDDTLCVGSPGALNASGGVTYSWTPDPSLTPSNVSNPTVTPTVTTTYTVTVTDANGCIGTDQVVVYVAPTPLSLTSTGLPTTCSSNCDGQGIVIPNGGYTPYNFQWSSGGTGPSEPNLCAGTFTITVTDDAGCTEQQTVTITSPSAMVLNTSATTANCGQNDGSATVVAAGGTGPYTYQWSSGGTGTTEINLAPGSYTVTVTDANLCTSQSVVVVPNTPGVQAQLVAFADVNCNGACNGSADGLGVGGTAPYSYSWSNGPNTQSVGNLCPGTYTVTVTDANGCQGTQTVTITEPPVLTCSPPAIAPTICQGQTTSLTASAAGGVGPYTYAWMPGAYVGNPYVVGPTTTTTYTVVATDANGCVSAPVTVTVSVNLPLAVTTSANVTICPGGNTTLTANGSGGDGNLTYTWQPGNLNGNSVNVTPGSTTTYTVTVSDGCATPVATATVSVTVQTQVAVIFAASTPTSGCADLCVDFVNSSPNVQSVLWDFGNGSTSTVNNPTYCFTTPGTYNVTLNIIDNNGCTGQLVMNNYITVHPDPVAAFTATPLVTTALSPNIDFTDLSQGANTWSWTFGDSIGTSSLQNPSYTYDGIGVYVVQLYVTNTFGCIDSVQIPVEVKEDYAIYVPNAFTPDGDGLNDIFLPQGIGINPDKYQFWIYDRWGNLIFTTTNFAQGWDGKVQGHSDLVQIDTYVWKIVTSDPFDAKHTYIGHVSVIR